MYPPTGVLTPVEVGGFTSPPWFPSWAPSSCLGSLVSSADAYSLPSDTQLDREEAQGGVQGEGNELNSAPSARVPIYCYGTRFEAAEFSSLPSP